MNEKPTISLWLTDSEANELQHILLIRMVDMGERKSRGGQLCAASAAALYDKVALAIQNPK